MHLGSVSRGKGSWRGEGDQRDGEAPIVASGSLSEQHRGQKVPVTKASKVGAAIGLRTDATRPRSECRSGGEARRDVGEARAKP